MAQINFKEEAIETIRAITKDEYRDIVDKTNLVETLTGLDCADILVTTQICKHKSTPLHLEYCNETVSRISVILEKLYSYPQIIPDIEKTMKSSLPKGSD